MNVKPWHPELAMVGMHVLSQVISGAKMDHSQTHPDEEPKQAKP